ncbi:MAG: glutamate-cysteine ligase family protein [Lachnospiraceae bacterium]|nr:glutamate-cysteine ligase family protein [Lachnospiraceae bacterium]
MENEIADDNLRLLTEHFEDGCKENCVQKLGVEIEHFIVDAQTRESISYYGPQGVEAVLRKIARFFPKQEIYAREHLIGMYNNDYSISLEPAGQIEISIAPKENISTIRQIYNSFLRILKPVLEEFDYRLVTLGYHPVSIVEDMPLIPKRRYEYMDAYFDETGRCGIHMMRGTASTQVSIDFCSEDDFVLKYRTAYLLAPALKLLTDNTPIFEGEPYMKNMARTYIWNNVDKDRCGMPPGLFDEDFGFRKYAEYLWNMPLILIPGEMHATYTGRKTTKELYEQKPLQQEDIDHILSMCFCDVRLKHYIEIRVADSMPLKYVLGYVALIKGIFFRKENLTALAEKYPVNQFMIEAATENLQINGFQGDIYGQSVKDFLEYVINLAEECLGYGEKDYLLSMKKIVNREETLAKEHHD